MGPISIILIVFQGDLPNFFTLISFPPSVKLKDEEKVSYLTDGHLMGETTFNET